MSIRLREAREMRMQPESGTPTQCAAPLEFKLQLAFNRRTNTPRPTAIELRKTSHPSFSLSLRGTSGERVGVRGIPNKNGPPLPVPLLPFWGGEGESLPEFSTRSLIQ